MIALAFAATLSTTLATIAPAPAAHAAPARWAWPLDPRPDVVVGFDPPDQPWNAGHRGVDLAARTGAEVRAAGAGVVTFAGLLAGRAVVVVSHGALRTTYLPVEPAVDVGERVDTGQTIGYVELIGGHCLPSACLHWGLLRGSEYLNPLSLVGAGPVRLLPIGGASTLAVPGHVGPVRRSVLRSVFEGASVLRPPIMLGPD